MAGVKDLTEYLDVKCYLKDFTIFCRINSVYNRCVGDKEGKLKKS